MRRFPSSKRSFFAQNGQVKNYVCLSQFATKDGWIGQHVCNIHVFNQLQSYTITTYHNNRLLSMIFGGFKGEQRLIQSRLSGDAPSLLSG